MMKDEAGGRIAQRGAPLAAFGARHCVALVASIATPLVLLIISYLVLLAIVILSTLPVGSPWSLLVWLFFLSGVVTLYTLVLLFPAAALAEWMGTLSRGGGGRYSRARVESSLRSRAAGHESVGEGMASTKKDLSPVFARLKAILQPYSVKLIVTLDTPAAYSLDTWHTMANGQALFFGAAHIRKAYVSYYLMPVYAYPDLLKGASPELLKRMQGKSCFNFTTVDEDLFRELAKLTRAGFARYKADKYV